LKLRNGEVGKLGKAEERPSVKHFPNFSTSSLPNFVSKELTETAKAKELGRQFDRVKG
jgi:hypothetical protein